MGTNPDFYDTPEWQLGDEAQKRWAIAIARRGHAVLPSYEMGQTSPETKAPMMFTADGRLVIPDLLVLNSKKPPQWHEVKAKTAPTWRIYKSKDCKCWRGPRWEHGIDYALMTEYRRVADLSGAPVYLVIHEPHSPKHPTAESPLSGPETWLLISLENAERFGDRREDWPGGSKEPNRRGRCRQGGWLWSRNVMTPIPFEVPG